MNTAQYSKFNNNNQVPQQTNIKRYWLVSILTAIPLGIAGFTAIVCGFMYAVTLSNPDNMMTMALMGIATAMLVVCIFFIIINRVIYAFFLRFSPLPKKYMMISNLIAWGVIGVMYLILSMLG